jgi:hypothetical protein
LFEVGARLSDVYGADHILWVEGPTEEEAFKLIVLQLIKNTPTSVSIVAVRATGDFESKRYPANMIFEIYSRLSGGNALIPSALAFIFDREARTETEINDLIRQSKGHIHFLNRRTYENYLLDMDGIASMYAGMAGFKGIADLPAKIAAWIKENGTNTKYLAIQNPTPEINSELWIKNVDAAKLLQDMTQDLSETKEEYRKTSHSVWLTSWIIENKPDLLNDVKQLLDKILKPASHE